jgi:hypothetical protein
VKRNTAEAEAIVLKEFGVRDSLHNKRSIEELQSVGL